MRIQIAFASVAAALQGAQKAPHRLAQQRATLVTPRGAVAAVADAEMATEAFDSLTSNRPADGNVFSCSLPELSKVCVGEEECDVGKTVRARLLAWLESADPEHVNWGHRGERIFRYDSASDAVLMTYYGPDGDMLEAKWPWNDAFFALYEWDMMC